MSRGYVSTTLNNISDFIAKYFWIFFILGILGGIFSPLFLLITPYILYMLIFVFFLSCLKIDIWEVIRQVKDFKLVIYLIFLILILIPLLIYSIFKIALEPEYSLAILILLIMPAGMATPVYATIFRASKELSLILLIISSILCPLTIPFMIYFLSGIKTDIDPFQMFISLAVIIFLPFIFSIIFRKFGKEFIKNTRKYYSSMSILIMAFIMAGAVAKANAWQIIKNDGSIILPLVSLFALAIFLPFIGYYAVYKRDKKTKISSSLAIAYMNSTLAIVFATRFFGPETLLLVTLYQIPTNLTIIILGYITNNRLYKQIKA